MANKKNSKIRPVKKIAKKTVTGKASGKKVPPKKTSRLKVTKTSTSSEPKALDALPVIAVPKRTPTKKIFGPNNSVTVVLNEISPSQVEETPEVVIAIEKPAAIVVPPAPKVSWNELPRTLPAQIKFFMNKAEKECEAAQAWPLPFAKFMASLPTEVCGLGLALVILGLEHDKEAVAQMSGLSLEHCEIVSGNAKVALEDRLSTICPEIFRKWRTQRISANVDATLFIEPYIVPKVDRNFQILLGAVLRSVVQYDQEERGRNQIVSLSSAAIN